MSLLNNLMKTVLKETNKQIKRSIRESKKRDRLNSKQKTRVRASDNVVQSKSEYQHSGKTDTIYLDIIDGSAFEKLCENIFSRLNYGQVQRTPLVGDMGKDLIIFSEQGKIFVECKHHLNCSIGRPVIQKLHSAVITEGAIKGIVVTTGTFSNGAVEYARKIQPPIELIDKGLLFDLASRVGLELETSLESGRIYSYPVTNDSLLQQYLCQYLNKNLISKPNNIDDITKINKRTICLKPVYLISYSIDAIFSTSIGIVHREQWAGKFFLNGKDGTVLDGNISNYFISIPMKKLSTQANQNMSIIPFELLSDEVNNYVLEHIIKKHVKTVGYRGANNQYYTKVCEPKKKDIFLKDISQVYISENDIDFTLNERKRFLKISDNGTDNFYIHQENVSACELCNKSLNKPGILCNDCGMIVHNKRFFFSHGFYCKSCGKSICRNCATYFSKYLIFKISLCLDCTKKEQEDGRKIKKYKPIKFV